MNVSRALSNLISGNKRDKQEIPWRYCRLASIELIGPLYFGWARVICEDDEGGQMFAIRCPGALFPELEPYAEELLTWRADPSVQDQPIIPIFFPEDGSPLFYPQADCPESQGCLTKAPPELLIHIQNASSGLTAPLSVSFLSRILKSASDSG